MLFRYSFTLISIRKEKLVYISAKQTAVDLYSILNGNPDLNGVWTNSAGAILASSFYNPATSSSDNFTYTINGVSPCPNDFAIVSVTNNTLPDAGQNTTHTICQNDAAFNMYNVLYFKYRV